MAKGGHQPPWAGPGGLAVQPVPVGSCWQGAGPQTPGQLAESPGTQRHRATIPGLVRAVSSPSWKGHFHKSLSWRKPSVRRKPSLLAQVGVGPGVSHPEQLRGPRG